MAPSSVRLDVFGESRLDQTLSSPPANITPSNHLDYQPYNPKNWPHSRKWFVTIIACYATLITNLNATGLTAAPRSIDDEFNIHSSRTFDPSFWPVTSWTVGAAVVPMVVLPLMENYGMRVGYIGGWLLFIVFVVPQAVAKNFATLVVTRFFAGSAAGILQDGMDGIIADVWPDAQSRSLPVTVYVFSLLSGASFGPVIGGAIVKYLHWRWIFYIQLIIYGVSTPLILCFPETRFSVIESRSILKAADHDEEKPTASAPSTGLSHPTTYQMVSEALIRPTYLLFTEPVVLFFTLLSALSYGLVFTSTQSIPLIYSTLYSFSDASSGILQISIIIGEVIGFLACLAQNEYFARAVRSANGDESKVLEARLWICVFGSIVGLTGGLFWYSWTVYSHFHWILPSIGLAFIGFGSMTVMQAIMIYITDSYTSHAASASAAVCAGEELCAAFLPLSTQALYTNLGFHWASTLLGFIALALSAAPAVMLWKGAQLRERSRWMMGVGRI